MRCFACGYEGTLNSWRVLNLSTDNKRQSLLKNQPANYNGLPGKSMYNNIYACPYCGTLKVKLPTERVKIKKN